MRIQIQIKMVKDEIINNQVDEEIVERRENSSENTKEEKKMPKWYYKTLGVESNELPQ